MSPPTTPTPAMETDARQIVRVFSPVGPCLTQGELIRTPREILHLPPMAGREPLRRGAAHLPRHGACGALLMLPGPCPDAISKRLHGLRGGRHT
jgi:hypothetical protein